MTADAAKEKDRTLRLRVMMWKIRKREIVLEKTLLMGVLNVTPDSFSDGGRFVRPDKAIRHGLRMVEEGADMVDLGGESTRPGAEPVSENEELNRLLPVLEALAGRIKVPISIDTAKPLVAKACLEKGAHIINDISGLKDSGPEMAAVVSDFSAGLILMHRRGTPKTMQDLTHYEDVVEDVLRELKGSVDIALASGIGHEQIVVDPGLGFAKTAEQNIEILCRLERFHSLGFPLLVGPSRKSFIGTITGRDIGDREYGTAAAAALAVAKGAAILRGHDVRAIRDAARMAEAIRGESYVRAF